MRPSRCEPDSRGYAVTSWPGSGHRACTQPQRGRTVPQEQAKTSGHPLKPYHHSRAINERGDCAGDEGTDIGISIGFVYQIKINGIHFEQIIGDLG
jgi:hypothetical protein